ncbi:MAG: alpha/beta fold hydrolase [Armatimonadetes bacterium]|nr:alpha/beta fold hydrolase [Armatimonadota bacterium]
MTAHREAVVNGVRLHYVEEGEGPTVVLLHGFPEFWYAWRHQIPALANAGFRVIAPDLRGYNLSEKPKGVRCYRHEALADDIAALIRHVGGGAAAVAGHDWGGFIAWYVPMRHPDLVNRLIVLNAPHPGVWFRDLPKPRQLLRSWYQFFFQLPWLPEATIRARDFALLRATLRHDPANPDAFSEEDVERYVEAMAQPGALTAAIHYYRAAMRRNPFQILREIRTIEVPALLIWGERDRYLGPWFTRGVERWVPNLRVECLPEASHWVMADEPERVYDLITRFLRED